MYYFDAQMFLNDYKLYLFILQHSIFLALMENLNFLSHGDNGSESLLQQMINRCS